jgi:hypothetical protein
LDPDQDRALIPVADFSDKMLKIKKISRGLFGQIDAENQRDLSVISLQPGTVALQGGMPGVMHDNITPVAAVHGNVSVHMR